ncbi:unnamed protein product, partial [Iphiclides podalirius]
MERARGDRAAARGVEGARDARPTAQGRRRRLPAAAYGAGGEQLISVQPAYTCALARSARRIRSQITPRLIKPLALRLSVPSCAPFSVGLAGSTSLGACSVKVARRNIAGLLLRYFSLELKLTKFSIYT